jgi:hypothetical protein
MPLLLRVTAPCSVAGPVADAQPDRFGTFEILDDQGQRVPLALPLWHVSAIRGWPHSCKTRTPSCFSDRLRLGSTVRVTSSEGARGIRPSRPNSSGAKFETFGRAPRVPVVRQEYPMPDRMESLLLAAVHGGSSAVRAPAAKMAAATDSLRAQPRRRSNRSGE